MESRDKNKATINQSFMGGPTWVEYTSESQKESDQELSILESMIREHLPERKAQLINNLSGLTEDNAINLLPSLFVNQKVECKIVFLQSKNGVLIPLGEKIFPTFRELERFTWDLSYSRVYIAFVKNETSNLITFRGRDKVVSYKNVNGKISLIFYKDKTVTRGSNFYERK